MPQDKTPSEAASELVDEFSGVVELNESELAEEIETLANQYSLTPDQAQDSVRSNIKSEEGIDNDELANETSSESNDLHDVSDITDDEMWVDLEVTFADEWKPRSDSIAQVGLFGDETGTIRFVAFETSDLPELEEGKSYRLENVVSDEYEGNYSVKLNRTTEIIELDDDIEPDDNTDSVTGATVEVDDGYGLIRRCPNNDCGKKLNDGRCRDHGEVDGDDDLALKLAVDTGSGVFTAYFDREETVELTGIDLDEALDIAHEEIDRSAVIDEMEPKLLGQYITVTGPTWEDDYGGDNIKANEYEANPNIGVDDTEQMLVKARSI